MPGEIVEFQLSSSRPQIFVSAVRSLDRPYTPNKADRVIAPEQAFAAARDTGLAVLSTVREAVHDFRWLAKSGVQLTRPVAFTSLFTRSRLPRASRTVLRLRNPVSRAAANACSGSDYAVRLVGSVWSVERSNSAHENLGAAAAKLELNDLSGHRVRQSACLDDLVVEDNIVVAGVRRDPTIACRELLLHSAALPLGELPNGNIGFEVLLNLPETLPMWRRTYPGDRSASRR